MEISVILPHVEALIFASEKPLTSLELTELINNALGFLDDKITLDQIESAVQGVIEKYDSDFYPFEIRESGGGWQFLTKKDFHKTVAQLNGDKFLKRLSAASLESLAIIAYKQPITKGEVESIRGVNSDYSIQKLLDKELIMITGRNEELPGKPLVYTTSKHFMDYFGINSSDELPMIKEILSSQPFLPTPVPKQDADGLFGDIPPEEEGAEPLVVRANGELIEEPMVVVDSITEVVEPEQVIENETPDMQEAEDSGLEEDDINESFEDEPEQVIEDEAENFQEADYNVELPEVEINESWQDEPQLETQDLLDNDPHENTSDEKESAIEPSSIDEDASPETPAPETHEEDESGQSVKED